MKRIIDGKTYNTDTAKKIGEYGTYNQTDFSYMNEGLYLTKKGQYFVAGQGGALSKYSTDVGNGHTAGGADIKLLSLEDAKEWAEENLDAEEYITEFGEIEG